jgi:hypothetical protein
MSSLTLSRSGDYFDAARNPMPTAKSFTRHADRKRAYNRPKRPLHLKNGGKTWKYLLIPHDEVKENFQLGDYVRKFERL